MIGISSGQYFSFEQIERKEYQKFYKIDYLTFAFFPIKKTARKRSSFSSDLPISGWCKQTRHLLHLLPTNRRRNRPSHLLQSRFASLLGDSHPI